MAAPLIPIIMAGARIVKGVPRAKAIELIKAGKAKWAHHVARDLGEGITKIAGKGKGAPKLDLPGAARRKAQRESGKKPAGKKYTWTAKGKKATGTTTPKKAAAPTAGVTRAAQMRKATGTAAPKSGTKTGTSTAQARLRRATGKTTIADQVKRAYKMPTSKRVTSKRVPTFLLETSTAVSYTHLTLPPILLV